MNCHLCGKKLMILGKVCDCPIIEYQEKTIDKKNESIDTLKQIIQILIKELRK